jgi:hypothetical protein
MASSLRIVNMNRREIQLDNGYIGTLGAGWMVAAVFTNDGHADMRTVACHGPDNGNTLVAINRGNN